MSVAVPYILSNRPTPKKKTTNNAINKSLLPRRINSPIQILETKEELSVIKAFPWE